MPTWNIRAHFMELLKSALRLWRRAGTRETLIQSAAELGRIWTRHPRRFVSPSLAELHEAADSTHLSVRDLLSSVLGSNVHEEMHGIQGEFDELENELERRYRDRSLTFGRVWGLERSTSILLFALTRLWKPSTVVETGVANGHSTFLFLHALKRNGHGQLHSIDVVPDVGGLLNEDETSRWSLHLLNQKRARPELGSLLDQLGKIDLFLHDSDHSYRWQRMELAAIHPRLHRPAVVACDDADASYAFIDYCADLQVGPRLLLDHRKVFGVVVIQ